MSIPNLTFDEEEPSILNKKKPNISISISKRDYGSKNSILTLTHLELAHRQELLTSFDFRQQSIFNAHQHLINSQDTGLAEFMLDREKITPNPIIKELVIYMPNESLVKPSKPSDHKDFLNNRNDFVHSMEENITPQSDKNISLIYELTKIIQSNENENENVNQDTDIIDPSKINEIILIILSKYFQICRSCLRGSRAPA